MKPPRQLRQRLRTLDALHDAVGAMKSLSAHHFRVARQGLPAARAYRDRIGQSLQAIGLPPLRGGEQPPGLFLVSTDLGLCGNYNTRLAATAAELQLPTGSRVYCVGRRGQSALRATGFPPDRSYSAATSVEGLQNLLLDVAEDLLDDYAAGRFGSLVMVAASFEGAGHFTPQVTRLLPMRVDPPEDGPRPSPYVSLTTLRAVAVREYLFIMLYETLLDALASEHGMRLVATEAAEQWLERSIEGVRRQLAAQRRETTTQELLDLIGGIESHNAANSGARCGD